MEGKAETGCNERLKGQLRGKVPGWAWLVGWLPAMLHSWFHDGDAAV